MDIVHTLPGKTVLVTGASSGIGRAVAVAVSVLGAKLIITGRDVSRLEETKTLLTGDGHRSVVAELTDKAARDELLRSLPPLDGVVFCAGFNRIKPAKFMDDVTLAETMSINFDAPYLMTCGMLRQRKVRDDGSIVFIGSIAADFAMPGNGVYSASKAALISAAKVLALETAKMRIRVNVVSPGQVMTPMTERTSLHISPEALAENEAQYPLGFGKPEDVAGVVNFLLSDASRWMTGRNLVLDGGFTLK